MSIAPVIVNFQVAGISQVQRAFRTVEQASVQSAQKVAAVDTRAAKDKERQFQQVAKDAERWKKQELAGAEKAAKQGLKVAQSADRDALRSKEQLARQYARIRENSVNMASRSAKQEADAELREMKRVQAERAKFRRAVGGAGARSLGNIASGAISMAGGALALGGGFAVASAMHDQLASQRAAIATSNAGYIPGQNTRVDPKQIMASASAASIATNIDKADVLKGLQTYTDRSSDLKGGMANLGFFSKLSKASGADFGEVMNAAGMMKAQNANLSDGDMQNMMRGIVGQGKLGAVSFSELAHSAATTTSTSGMYNGDQATSQRRLLGLQQIAVKTAGSSDDAATVVSRFGSDIMAHQKGMKAKHGINAADASGMLNDPAQILGQLFDKGKGNLNSIREMGGLGKESLKLAEALAPVYQLAEKAKKGSGGAAVSAEVSKYEGAGYSQEDVDKDFGEVMKSAAERIDTASTKIREILETKLAPYLERFANALPTLMPKIERVIDAFDKLATVFLDNPIKGIGAIIAGKVVKDVGSAMLGDVLKKILVESAGGKTGAGLVQAVLGTGGGAVAAIGSVALPAAIAGVVGGALYGTAMQDDPDVRRAQGVAYAKGDPKKLQAMISDLTQRDKKLDPQSAEYLGNEAFISGANGASGTGGKFDLTQDQKDKVGAGVKNLDALQLGNAKGGVPIDQLINFKPLQDIIDGKVGGGRVASADSPSRNNSLAHPARGGAQ
jgi:hypothetical protein